MSTYTKIKTLPLSLFNNAEYLSFMNHVLDLANGNSGGGDSESPDEISLLTGSDGIPELGLTKEFLDTYEADLLAMADVRAGNRANDLARDEPRQPHHLYHHPHLARRHAPVGGRA